MDQEHRAVFDVVRDPYLRRSQLRDGLRKADRIWGIGGSDYNKPKVTFYLPKGDWASCAILDSMSVKKACPGDLRGAVIAKYVLV